METTTYLISPKEACKRTSLTRPTLERLIEDGDFPKPVRITERRLAFDASAVQAWIAARLQGAA